MSNRWQNMSLRRLIYLLRKGQAGGGDTEIYAEVYQRLGLYFEQPSRTPALHKLRFYKEEILTDTISELVENYPTVRKHSWGYITFVRKVLLSVCNRDLKWLDRNVFVLDQPTFDDANSDIVDQFVTTMYEDAVHFQLEDVIAQLQTAELIERAWLRLKPKHRSLLDDHLKHELPLKEAGKRASMKSSTARVEYRRGVNELLKFFIQEVAGVDTPSQIRSHIRELPEQDRILISGWWAGRSWKAIGQQLPSPSSQSETKQLFVSALLKLFHFLETNDRL